MLLFAAIVCWDFFVGRSCKNIYCKAVVYLFTSVVMAPNIEPLHLFNLKSCLKLFHFIGARLPYYVVIKSSYIIL